MRYTINLDCKTHHVGRDGKFPILLRISLNGKQDYINTGKRILEEHYDKEKKSIKSGIKGFNNLDRLVSRHKTRIEAILDDFDKKGEIPTISKIKAIYEQETGKVKSKSFYDFVESKIKWEEDNKQITKGTLKNYKHHLEKLNKYNPKLSIHDIDAKFLDEYKSYIINSLGQANNTAYHAMCFLRKYTKILFKDNMISPYPFSEYKVGSTFGTDTNYLEIEELKRLHDLYDSKELISIIKKAKNKHGRDFKVGEKYQEVLRYFLFACYTGLRHSDIKTLRTTHIRGNFIVKTVVKGYKGRSKLVRIPIRKRLLSLIDQQNTRELIFENPVMEDSQTNKYLKKIMEIANINKHITFHCSRHSFSIISLLMGVKFEVVSDILGHSELTTTQRYARVVDSLRDKEMDKWDKMADSNDYHQIFCPKCETLVLNLEKNVINLNKLPCICQVCTTPFLFPLKENEKQLINKQLDYIPISA
jgi:integrase